MSRWIDLTHLIDEHTLTYPGDPLFKRQTMANHLENGFQIEQITTAMHVGTHLDSPFHFIDGGKTVDQINPSLLVGNAIVVHIDVDRGIIPSQQIEEQLLGVNHPASILLIDTGHSKYFNTDTYFSPIPAFEPSIVDIFERFHIQVVGLDLPTVSFPNNHIKEAHLAILSKDMVIIEGLNHLEECHGLIDFIGLPLNIRGIDGSMIRAIGRNKE